MNIGDIVEYKGRTGVVVRIKGLGGNSILVDYAMSGWFKGHNGNSPIIALPSPSGWWHDEAELTIVSSNVYENLIIE